MKETIQDEIRRSPDLNLSPAQLLGKAGELLARAGVPEPESDARILLFH